MWGQALLPDKVITNRRDHPHACGDKTAIPIRTGTSVGSSPRVWRQVHCAFSYNSSQRIIPTRVRTRLYHRTFNLSIGDHPHACGDKLHRLIRRLLKRGSSPRVWGQGMLPLLRLTRSRIIPTRVGTSISHHCTKTMAPGSSPRVWGQAYRCTPFPSISRIIPTRVGTSFPLYPVRTQY